MGSELNNALKTLISPKVPESLSFVEIRTTLVNHFDKKKNQYAESIRIRQVIQEKDETLSNFVLRLRQAATHCKYGEFLNRMLTEQLLFGLESRNTCDQIIAKEPENFNAAYEIAQRLEASHMSSMEMKNAAGGSVPLLESTFKENVKDTKIDRSNCYGCGGDHARTICKFRNARCYLCGKTGHIAKVCKSKTAQISEEHTDNIKIGDSDVIQRLNKVGTKKESSRHLIGVEINGGKVNMELDTGAPCGIMSMATVKSCTDKYKLLTTDRKFTSYTGHRIDCIGRVVVNVKVGATTRRLNLYIVDGNFDSLLGIEWISQFVGEIDFVKLFSTSEPVEAIKMDSPSLSAHESQILGQVLAEFEEIFSDTAGTWSHDKLQLFLGKATYYGSFIVDLSTRSRPLHDMLLRKQFQWTKEGEQSNRDIKNALISPQVLMPYKPELPLLLATDASEMLSHRMPDGRERPIAYASRTLTATERKYPQIDKEALAIVWAVWKFFFYLYARHFTLITDHKPLTQILDLYKSLPVLCISRMANYADFLGNFDFDVMF
ncbi:Retrovirus-related Pol polyprotein from transposon 412 [Lucilia cuprina]|nr:Retrovirus-related Pol polyprotein from transposon 412 [Lucilia cuprina]